MEFACSEGRVINGYSKQKNTLAAALVASLLTAVKQHIEVH
jgi:hypothetical protein